MAYKTPTKAEGGNFPPMLGSGLQRPTREDLTEPRGYVREMKELSGMQASVAVCIAVITTFR
ncbi:hypothetical protein CTA1_8277 [Colletotrichum tanaceti]|uniref:Uncharacterized protein n=1 Tax=Colletotrichum tanaceti TaxID=1306861 RepID=A0A4U6XJZ7_9PEZI|nr:hypothetical protein CTA1_8277 [Colletotrichum tanaceti]